MKQNIMKSASVILAITLTLVLTSCAALRNQHKKPPAPLPNYYQYQPDQTITGYDINGPFPVHIIVSKTKNRIIAQGNNVSPQTLVITPKNHILHLTWRQGTLRYAKTWRITIYTRFLNNLQHRGDGKLTVSGIKHQPLSIYQNGHGPILVKGKSIYLQKAINNSQGDLKVTGINSPNVDVTQWGNGHVFLSGRVGLNRLITRGNGKVVVRGVTPTPLYINARGNGNVVLIGQINARQINHDGNGDMILEGVRSKHLSVNAAGDGKMSLLGIANLVYLGYHGGGNVYINKIESQNLKLFIYGHGNLALNGDIGLSELRYDGTADLDVTWVDSDHLKIDAFGGCGNIMLAGVTHQLNADVHGQVHINARYLRTDDAHIKTTDHGFIETWVRHALNARAVDYSNIYYYKRPEFLGKYMGGSGAVLPMHYLQ